MKMKLDLVFIREFNKYFGLNISFKEFRNFYRKVVEARENDECYQKRHKKYFSENKSYLEALSGGIDWYAPWLSSGLSGTMVFQKCLNLGNFERLLKR